MSRSEQPVRNPVVAFSEEFDGWGVLLNPDTGAAMELNPVGTAVWKLADGQRTLEQIVAVIEKQFDEVPDTVRKDVVAFVSRLVQAGFLS